MLLSIAQLLRQGRAANHPIYRDHAGNVTWQIFANRLARLVAYVSAHGGQRWLLACDDAGEFALWLLALLATGKQIVIPPNFQPGTLQQLSADCDAGAGDLDIEAIEALPAATGIAADGLDAARIALYTSGSSGDAKCVIKTLAQLEREVFVHEAQWGAELQGAAIIATVPHHHIYGLLFRLLGPLMSGRTFDAVQCAHPDMLQQRAGLFDRSALIASPAQLIRLPQLIALDRIAPWPCMIFSSGGPLPLEATQALREHGGRAPVEVYGSTETGGMAWRDQTRDAWWTPLPGVTLDNDSSDGDGARLHSPFLPDATPHRLDDAVELAADGRFRLLGRIDRVVKVEEKRLSLPELEARLQEHAWVAQAAAVVLNGARQRIGMALTLTDAGRAALAELGRPGMRTHLREHLAAHFDTVLLPRRWRYLDALPYTAQGKLPVAALQALFAE